MVGRANVGSYSGINRVITEVEDFAKAHGLECDQTYGKYLDDPELVDPDRLRSEGGCIVNKNSGSVWKAALDQNKRDFVVSNLPKASYLIARFEGSPAIGP